MKPTELLELVIQRVPCPNLVTGIDVTSEPDALHFTWRNVRFRVEEGKLGICAEEVRNGGFVGSDIAILMREVLNREPARPEPPAAPAEPEDPGPPVLFWLDPVGDDPNGWYVTTSEYVAGKAYDTGRRVRRYEPA